MTVEELLPLLRDIQPPPEPTWWYLSPAFTSFIGIILLATVVIWLVFRRRRANRLVDQAQTELNRIVANHEYTGDDRRFALDLAHWLKRVALVAFPNQQLESTIGQTWLEFLDQSMERTHFSGGNGHIFGGAVYQEHLDFDTSKATELCTQWLMAITPQLQQRGRNPC